MPGAPADIALAYLPRAIEAGNQSDEHSRIVSKLIGDHIAVVAGLLESKGDPRKVALVLAGRFATQIGLFPSPAAKCVSSILSLTLDVAGIAPSVASLAGLPLVAALGTLAVLDARDLGQHCFSHAERLPGIESFSHGEDSQSYVGKVSLNSKVSGASDGSSLPQTGIALPAIPKPNRNHAGRPHTEPNRDGSLFDHHRGNSDKQSGGGGEKGPTKSEGSNKQKEPLTKPDRSTIDVGIDPRQKA